ncbi:MAG: hypothetical protein R3A46_15860 [Thermomicrobiales bacterium]
MDVNQIVLISLRVFHAVAAVVWLGGGLYYFVALRPLGDRETARQAQQRFREWAQPATLIMLASGTILLFDGLSSSRAGVTYAAILALKIGAALAAFWLVSFRRRRPGAPRPSLALSLGMAAFVLGVVISSIWAPE